MQDAGAFEMPSASNEGLGSNVVHGVALGESTYVAVDPNNPKVTYGAAYYSALARLDTSTGDEKNVTPWAIYLAGHQASDTKYRFGWTIRSCSRLRNRIRSSKPRRFCSAATTTDSPGR